MRCVYLRDLDDVHDSSHWLDVCIQNSNLHLLNRLLMVAERLDDEHRTMMTMAMIDHVKHEVYYQQNSTFHDYSLNLKISNQDFVELD